MADLFDIAVAKKLAGGSGGGGGSSDFSTAQVTFVNQLSASAIFYFPVLTVGSDEELVITSSILVGAGNSVNADVVLYKDASYGYTNSRGTITVSGDVVYDDDTLVVTGDCTVTLSHVD